MSEDNVLSIKQIQDKLDIDEIAARFFKSRAIETEEIIDEYLNSSLEDLDDPNTIPGMYDVINVIKNHVENNNIITIYGDFDVDGTSALTIMYKALSIYYDSSKVNMLPANRYRDSYGLSCKSIDIMGKADTDLIITVDCGISDHDEIDYAQLNGMDVVIVDHHEADKPPDVPLIDPKVEQGNYMERELCATGLAWRLAQALLGERFEEVLDIVAMATIADVVPLLGENRIIVKEGLDKIKHFNSVNLGIVKLMNQFEITPSEITASDIGYFVGPAINAAGRLGSPKPVIKLLNTKKPETAEELAFKLKNINERRKDRTKKTLKGINKKIKRYAKDCNVIIETGDILRGVVGLVAGNIKERYGKPTIIIDEDSGKGSARSVPPFDMYENLKTCREEDLLEKAGGHSMAAGLKVKDGRLEEFKDRMNELAEGMKYEVRTYDIIVNPMDISLTTIRGLNLLAPFGKSHPGPLFRSEDIKAQNISRTFKGDHLTFDIGESHVVNKAEEMAKANPQELAFGAGGAENLQDNVKRCIAFGQAYEFQKLINGTVNIEYEPCYDTFDENNDIQFIVRNIETNEPTIC